MSLDEQQIMTDLDSLVQDELKVVGGLCEFNPVGAYGPRALRFIRYTRYHCINVLQRVLRAAPTIMMEQTQPESRL